MKRVSLKLITWMLVSLLPVSLSFGGQAQDQADFDDVVTAIRAVPYNPRPIATNTKDVTGISEDDSRSQFLSTFTRVTIPAPANGRTFKASDPTNNHDDITLVGYVAVPSGPLRLWVILTHGGAGSGSIAGQGGFLIHLANVLYANGFAVLAVDKRDGLLSRCAYKNQDSDGDGKLDPDPANSQRAFASGSRTQYCDSLHNDFRQQQVNAGFVANSLITGRSAFEAGDILAAAKYVRDTYGAARISVLGGSHGGLAAIRAAYIQGLPGFDFRSDLLTAVLAISPVDDHNTVQYDSSETEFACDRAGSAKFYSLNVYGSGIRDFTSDPVGAVDDFFAMLNGVDQLPGVTAHTFIIFTLADFQSPGRAAFAYKAMSDIIGKNKTGGVQGPGISTLIMTRLGHFHEIWQSDPYWMDKVVLTYFKKLMADQTIAITDNPGFSSLGSNADNPFIFDVDFKKEEELDKFLAPSSVATYLVGPTGVCGL